MIKLALLWTAWCALHSLLISRKAHRLADNILGRSRGAYRLAYVLFSSITLAPVLWYQFLLPEKLLLQPNLPVRFMQAAMLFYGFLMFYFGARVYDMRYFLGITQWLDSTTSEKTAPLPFHTDGILAHVRHPWYSGGIAIVWGFGSITDVYLLTRIILTGYFIIGTYLEEKRLRAELGDAYREYTTKVPALFPWKL